ncbi:MAG: DNRLRE domain-containing protein [Anaerolineales bacterium]|nr:DNRLRE domain-containing protein [Anaerolineales bacterium]
MTRRLLTPLLVALLLIGGRAASADAHDPTFPTAAGGGLRRIYAPYNLMGHESPIFWFGQVTPSLNYADVRVGYRDEYVFVHVAIIDRRLWYDTSPSPSDLTEWDSVSLYLHASPASASGLTAADYRFDGQLYWFGDDRTPYQAAYRGVGGHWSPVSFAFETRVSWSGDMVNNNVDDRGWWLLYRIPFSSLGMSAPPPEGTMWRIGVVLHDRDDQAGLERTSQVWPETLTSTNPATWGELVYGLPSPYDPPDLVYGGVTTIRHGLNGAVVTDADVGGSSNCGAPAGPGFFPTWGALNYAGKEFSNIQGLVIGDWPCLSKYYVTFPLDLIPDRQAIISATLTLYQSGHAGVGWDPGPQPSLIQVATIDRDWDEATLTWNNAPLAVEMVSRAWVDPVAVVPPPWPGVARHWDVSGAVAQAYAAGEPLRLALYSPTFDMNQGKYFYTSDVGYTGEGRPTLTVAWGQPPAELTKSVSTAAVWQGDSVDYSLSFLGTGGALALTDTLPTGAAWTGNVLLQGTASSPVYDSAHHRLTWGGSPPWGRRVIITYTMSIGVAEAQALVNAADLVDGDGRRTSAEVMVIANPTQTLLPIVFRER